MDGGVGGAEPGNCKTRMVPGDVHGIANEKRTVSDAAMRKIKRAPREELSVGLGMVLDCGHILPRERVWRKRELRELSQAGRSEGTEIRLA